MTRRRTRWAVAVITVVAVGAVAAVVVHQRPSGWLRFPAAPDPVAPDATPPEPPASPEPGTITVPAGDATWVRADQPESVTDASSGLFAGDHNGGAITYLRFDVDAGDGEGYDRATSFTSATLELTIQDGAPELLEVTVVPDTSWRATDLSWSNAPLLGSVVRSIYPGGQPRVSLDLTGVVTAPGEYAFAVTVPPDYGSLSLAGPGEQGAPVLRVHRPDATPGGPSAEPGGPAGSGLPPSGQRDRAQCTLGDLLVPSCGKLWGVAPAGHTGMPRTAALEQFERDTGRRQDIFHAYHRAESLFPTAEEVAIAAEGRILFLNWKPLNWSWAQIAAGHPAADGYLDRLAAHIQATFTQPFFFTIHHEPENDVRPTPGSGWEATDYAAMFRYVIERLRGAGVDNLVTVMNHLAYVPLTAQPWFPDLYPGDDVVDWIGWNSYAYSDPGYGYGDFAELVNRRSEQHPQWPGFYSWATRHLPDKPFMLAEWGVWHSADNPGHMATFFESAIRQAPLFPRLKALVYFDTPADQRDRDSRPIATDDGLRQFQRLSAQRHFTVELVAH